MPSSLSVVVFDVNETLSDMAPMAERFAAVGAPPGLVKVWFTGVLRDGFALTATGGSERFATIAADGARRLLAPLQLNVDVDEAVGAILSGLSALPLHPDVADGVRVLRQAGFRLVTLSNGSTQVADALLGAAGVRSEFEALLSVEGAGLWKPAAGAYAYAIEACGVTAAEAVLVAVHPWDIHGAANAGLASAWINRDGGGYPVYFTAPTYQVGGVGELATVLAG